MAEKEPVPKDATAVVEVTWLCGDKRYNIVKTKIREHTILMDTPPFEREEKHSLGPSATETYMAAIGRCNLASIMIAAENLGVKINGLKAKLEGKLRRKDPEETGFPFEVWRFQEILINLEIKTEADKQKVAEVLRESHKISLIGNAIKDGIAGKFNDVKIYNQTS